MSKIKGDTLLFLEDSKQVEVIKKMNICIDHVPNSKCFVLPCKMDSSEAYYLYVTAYANVKSKKGKVKLAIPHSVVVLTAAVPPKEEGIGTIIGFGNSSAAAK